MANAKKFNNGENLGTVRQILNDNADAINQRVEKEDGKDLITAAERVKLNGIATGATANSSDEALRARSTHTGTQSADTITDGNTNKVFTLADKTKLNGIDVNAYVLKDGTKVLSDRNYTVDKDNKLGGIAFSATKNATDAQLRDRTTHTGFQDISTVTNLQTELNNRPPTTSGSPTKPTGIWYGTQAQYDALATKTATFKYEIYEA